MKRKINLVFTVLVIFFSLNIYKNAREKELSFWTLEQNHATIGLRKISDNRELLAGEVIIGYFKAKYNNLSKVAFWFNTYNRVNKDRLIFRIKNVSEDSFLFQTQVDTDQLIQDKLYQFVFPSLKDSKGKNYQFELESLTGATGSAIYVSNLHSTPAIRYPFSLSLLRDEKSNLALFVIEKVVYYLHDQEILSAVVALLIVIIYRFVLLRIRSFYPISFLLIVGIILAIFMFNTGSSQVIGLTLFLLWVVSNIYYKVSSVVSVLNAIVLLVLGIIIYVTGNKILSESFATWSLLFIFSAAVIQNSQLHSPPTVGLRQFWLSSIDYLILTIRFFHNGSIVINNAGMKTYEIYAVFSDRFNERIRPVDQIENENTIKLSNYEKHLVIKISADTYQFIKRLSFLYPYFIFIAILGPIFYLIYSGFGRFRGYLQVYYSYFPAHQLQIFIKQTGAYLILWYLLVIAALVIVFLKYYKFTQSTRLRYEVVVAVLALYLMRMGGDRIFDHTSSYFRDNIRVWEIVPSETNEPWVDVTIRGVNFKDTPFWGDVYVNNIPHRVIEWSNKEIIFRTDPGKTKTGNIRVENVDGKISNTVNFTYTGNR